MVRGAHLPRRASGAVVRLVRWMVLLVAIPLSSSGALPYWAHLVAPDTHVCHCSVAEHDCLCAKCNPDRPELWTSDASLKGACGDDETVFGAKFARATLPGPLEIVPGEVPEPTLQAMPLLVPVHGPPRTPLLPPPRA